MGGGVVERAEKRDEIKTRGEKLREKAQAQDALEVFDRIDEEDRQGKRLYAKNETYGYVDPNSFSAASLDKPIGEDNRGYRLLVKMGWKGQGKGLGKDGKGISAPVALGDASAAGLGLGKGSEYERYNTEVTASRKLLEAEKKETAQEKVSRETLAQAQQNIKDEVTRMNREFFCPDCDKQYKTVKEMENHLSSYDHHHVRRLKQLKEDERARKGKTFDRGKAEKREWEKMQQRAARAAAASSIASDGAVGAAATGTTTGSSTSMATGVVTGAAPIKFGFGGRAGAGKKGKQNPKLGRR